MTSSVVWQTKPNVVIHPAPDQARCSHYSCFPQPRLPGAAREPIQPLPLPKRRTNSSLSRSPAHTSSAFPSHFSADNSLATTLQIIDARLHTYITSCNTCRNPGHTAPSAPQCRSSLRRPGLLSCPFLSQPLTSKAARCIFSTTCKYAITLKKSNNCNFSWSFLQQLQKLEMGAKTNHHLSWKISDFAVCSFHFEPRYSLQSRKDISKTAITELYMTSVITVSCTVRRC